MPIDISNKYKVTQLRHYTRKINGNNNSVFPKAIWEKYVSREHLVQYTITLYTSNMYRCQFINCMILFPGLIYI